MKKDKIKEILEFIEEHKLFTNSNTHRKVQQRFIKNKNEKIKFIISSGEPTGTKECSECRKQLPADQFKYYQTRVDSQGYLMRANALCASCSRILNSDRAKILDNEDIPPRPEPGDVCDNCGRIWYNTWHRDHSYKDDKFLGWICGNCNMAKQDRRNPKS